MGLKKYMKTLGFIIFSIFLFLWIILSPTSSNKERKRTIAIDPQDTLSVEWHAPDISEIPATPKGELISYGRELIIHTASYFGPKGKISTKANGLNCQNCHLYAGTKLFGNNFSLVATTYPKYRARSGGDETITARVNGCMERSMNGSPIDTTSREMHAMIAYLNWIGKDVPKNRKILGSGTETLPYLNRPADAVKGKIVYIFKCARCHGNDGQGILRNDSSEYYFPPLWGKNSYNIAAGIYRISNLAAFVKTNMPFGATHNFPLLSNEEAWDVAAFVNSQPHPYMDYRKDFPVLTTKPIDYPFGPYADNFSENQHKYGPFIGMGNIAKK
ncbi:MAG: c-type cytochrome [Ginsengibacter sp.]